MNNRLLPPFYEMGDFVVEGKVLQTTTSSLHKGFLGRLYADSDEVGFCVLSRETNTAVTFRLVKEEGEPPTVWHFKPIREDRKKAPGVKVVVVGN